MTMVRNQHLMDKYASPAGLHLKAKMIGKDGGNHRQWKLTLNGTQFFSFKGNLYDIHNIQELNGRYIVCSYALRNMKTGAISDAVRVFKKKQKSYQPVKPETMGVSVRQVMVRQGAQLSPKNGYFLEGDQLFASSKTCHILDVKKYGKYAVVEYSMQMKNIRTDKEGNDFARGHILGAKKTGVFENTSEGWKSMRHNVQRVSYHVDPMDADSWVLDIVAMGKVVQRLTTERPDKKHIRNMYKRAIEVGMAPKSYLSQYAKIAR